MNVQMIKIVSLVYVIWNLCTFLLIGMDKVKARKGRWRIQEKLLLGSAFFGGALGGTLGMYVFHHKTRHWYFRYGFPFLLFLQVFFGTLLWRQMM